MAKYVKTDYVPEDVKRYLTAGKEYIVFNESVGGGWIRSEDDKVGDIFILFEECMFLDLEAWTVINR